MGRDWYWGRGAKTSSTSNSSMRASERDPGQTTPSGCISAVFHLFDFNYFQFPLNHQSSSSSCSCFKPDSFLSPDTTTTTTLKGSFFHSLSLRFFPFNFEILRVTSSNAMQVQRHQGTVWNQRRKVQLQLH